MRRLLLATFGSLVLLVGVASASSGPAPIGRIVFGMNHFCLTPDPNGGGNVPVDCGKGEIAVVNADGSGLRVLTHNNVTETSPVWSPNHKQIAFIRPKAHTSDQVWVMNANGTTQHALTHLTNRRQLYGNDVTPDLTWSTDGLLLVFAAYTKAHRLEQLYVEEVLTHRVSQLTHLPTGATEPEWSPNNRWIAFVSAVAPDRIYLLSVATDKAHAVGDATGLDIAWSPNSKQLVFNSHGKLELVNTAGTHYRSLGVFGQQPSWSPDGQWIVFTEGGYMNEIRPDGKDMHHILHVSSEKGENFEPNW